MEETALEEIASVLMLSYRKCGLFIHNLFPYIGASPDALIEGASGIIEIKSPYAAYTKT